MHAFAVLTTSAATDWFTFAIDFLVAHFTYAYLRRETISVLITRMRADSLANTFLVTPTLFAATDIRSCASTPETALRAIRYAWTVVIIASVALATV